MYVEKNLHVLDALADEEVGLMALPVELLVAVVLLHGGHLLGEALWLVHDATVAGVVDLVDDLLHQFLLAVVLSILDVISFADVLVYRCVYFRCFRCRGRWAG